MPLNFARTFAGLFALTIIPIAAPALAQDAGEDALKQSDDAFGTRVGLETTGIYTEGDTRGFSPLDAGNVRLDGIYFDQVAVPVSRFRQSTAIRVGFAAADTPFVAPTGIVDHKIRGFPAESGKSIILNRYYYGGYFHEFEYRARLSDRFAIRGGFAAAEVGQSDGADGASYAVTVIPIVRVAGFEFTPFYTGGQSGRDEIRPIVLVEKGYLPKVQPNRRYLGQDWAAAKRIYANFGGALKGQITEQLSFRGGIFKSFNNKPRNFSEIFAVEAANGLSSHFVIADPPHDVRSISGEGQFVWRFESGRSTHRIFAGYRSRNRLTETGGSQFFDLGHVIYGEIDRIDKPEFAFSAVDSGRIRQSSWMLAYVGQLAGLGSINLGVQKARYRATLKDGETGLTDRSRAAPWLYNASLLVPINASLSAYAATQKGLEDSGIAPGNAANRDQQLPAATSTQYEGGIKWDFDQSHLVIAAFQITKPYFSYDADRAFVIIGNQRHRGLELSYSGQLTDRLGLLAGAVLMKPAVTGPGRSRGLVGKRPAGVANLLARLDASYRTDLPGDLTFTTGLHYESRRAASGSPIDHLGGSQLMLLGTFDMDAGIRQVWHLRKTDLSLRVLVRNLFDEGAWNVIAPDVLMMKDRRSFIATFTVDF